VHKGLLRLCSMRESAILYLGGPRSAWISCHRSSRVVTIAAPSSRPPQHIGVCQFRVLSLLRQWVFCPGSMDYVFQSLWGLIVPYDAAWFWRYDAPMNVPVCWVSPYLAILPWSPSSSASSRVFRWLSVVARFCFLWPFRVPLCLTRMLLLSNLVSLALS
jgi:hypothetical protein